jgi:hypothetical protein
MRDVEGRMRGLGSWGANWWEREGAEFVGAKRRGEGSV